MRTQFTPAELRFLLGERHLARLATIQSDGQPHVVPVGWSYDAETGTIIVSGRDFANTRKFHNAKANPKVAIVIDDVLPPWRPRCVMVQGVAEAVEQSASAPGHAFIRVHPTKIISFGDLAGDAGASSPPGSNGQEEGP